MKKLAGKMLAWVLILILTIGSIGLWPMQLQTAPAPGIAITSMSLGIEIASGTLGQGGAPWRLHDDGTVVVDSGFAQTGTGWNAHSNQIQKIIFTGPIEARPQIWGFFSGLVNLREIYGLSYFNTENATSMRNMFRDTRSLTNVDLSSFNTSNVTDMYNMFRNASSLQALDLSNFDTRNVSNMGEMFRGTYNLVDLNISSFNTGNVDGNAIASMVTGMNGMFRDARSLVYLDLSHFDTSNVVNVYRMFAGSSSLMNLNLSGWDVSNVVLSNAFLSGAASLNAIDLSEVYIGAMSNPSNLLPDNSNEIILRNDQLYLLLPGFPFVPSNIIYTGRWRNLGNGTIDNPLGAYFYRRGDVITGFVNPATVNTWVWARRDNDNFPALGASLIHTSGSIFGPLPPWRLYNCGTLIIRGGVIGHTGGTHARSIWSEHYSNVSNSIDRIIFTETLTPRTNLSGLFGSLPGLVVIEGLEYLDTSNVTNMIRMFSMALNLTALNLSGFDTRNVGLMDSMFEGTHSLREISLGENFRFIGGASTGISDPRLSGPAVSWGVPSQYSGRWRNVGTGVVEIPQGEFTLSPRQLMMYFDGSTMADTWVWERSILVEEIVLNFQNLNMSIGDTETLIATMVPSNTTSQLRWVNSNPLVVSISDCGLITALASGTTRIIATTSCGVREETIVSVATIQQLIAPAPMASLQSGQFVVSGTPVSLNASIAGARIHYTLDGSEPTQNSPIMTSPILITGATVIRARTFIDGMLPSNIPTFIFNTWQTTVAPTAIPYSSVVMHGSFVNLQAEHPLDIIRFTTDGSVPTERSQLFSQPIQITQHISISAKTFPTRSGFLPSDIVIFNYYAQLSPPNVIIRNPQPISGKVVDGAEIIFFSPPGSSVRFTTDGTAPTQYSPVFFEPFRISGQTTIKAMAYGGNLISSDVLIHVIDNIQVAPPIPSVDTGTVFTGTQVSLSTWTSNAIIRFTLDGSEPTEDSPELLFPITINEQTTIKARAFRGDFTPSELVILNYDVRVAMPFIGTCFFAYENLQSFFVSIGDNVLMRSATEGARIHFTLDGTEPTEISPLFSDMFILSTPLYQHGGIIRARAFKDGFEPSYLNP